MNFIVLCWVGFWECLVMKGAFWSEVEASLCCGNHRHCSARTGRTGSCGPHHRHDWAPVFCTLPIPLWGMNWNTRGLGWFYQTCYFCWEVPPFPSKFGLFIRPVLCFRSCNFSSIRWNGDLNSFGSGPWGRRWLAFSSSFFKWWASSRVTFWNLIHAFSLSLFPPGVTLIACQSWAFHGWPWSGQSACSRKEPCSVLTWRHRWTQHPVTSWRWFGLHKQRGFTF